MSESRHTSRIGEQIIPPAIMKKITAAMKRELAMNWQSDDDVIDSFSRIASIAFLEGGAAMLPESSAASESVSLKTASLEELEQANAPRSAEQPTIAQRLRAKGFADVGQGAPTSSVVAITEVEAAQLLDDGFAIKVLNPERGNYWRCPHCDMADYDGHEQSCVIRALVERLLGRHIPFGTLSATLPQEATDSMCLLGWDAYMTAQKDGANIVERMRRVWVRMNDARSDRAGVTK